MYDNDTPSWSFAPIAASGSTLALLLSHDTQKPTSALPRSAYTILIQKYGAQELVAIGDTNGEPVASLEFNTFPLPDRIQLGSGAPTLPLSTWWKREESKVVYKRDVVGSFRDAHGHSFSWCRRAEPRVGGRRSLRDALVLTTQDTGDIAALHTACDGGMRLQVLHPCAAEIMDRCVISAMVLLKTFSKHRRRTGLDSPEDLW